VSLVRGFCEANGKFYNINANEVHNLTGLISAFGFQYIYIDDDASSPPNPIFINSLTPPVWSDAKMGWYGTETEPASPSTNDKMICVVFSPTGSAIVAPFVANALGGKTVVCETGSNSDFTMGTAMTPTGAWITPTTKDGSAVTPVNATAIKLFVSNSHGGALCRNYLANAEFATLESDITKSPFVSWGQIWDGITTWVELGSSRNIKVAGEGDDNAAQQLSAKGFRYTR
jgi:hypothetical protein